MEYMKEGTRFFIKNTENNGILASKTILNIIKFINYFKKKAIIIFQNNMDNEHLTFEMRNIRLNYSRTVAEGMISYFLNQVWIHFL